MNIVLSLFLILVSTNSLLYAGPKDPEPLYGEMHFEDNEKTEIKKSRKRKTLTMTCPSFEHTALIYGTSKPIKTKQSERFCKGSDDKEYMVKFQTLGVSALHVCVEDVVLVFNLYEINSIIGTWWGGSFELVLLFGGGAHVMFRKDRAVALVGAFGCGIGFHIGTTRLTIKPSNS